MKKQTKTIILSIALCLIFALGVFCVYSLQNFSLSGGGSIKFIAPGINATISEATLTGLSKKSGSGQMQSFKVTPDMTTAQIQELSGYKSWSGLKLLLDNQDTGMATISFTITNNSARTVENIMVELSTNTTNQSPIQAIPSADFCIGPKQNHTFTIDFYVSNMAEAEAKDYFVLFDYQERSPLTGEARTVVVD
jgi:hypothetical protein